MPKRSGTTEILFPFSTTGMNPDEITIAELLKKKGYTTAIVGKWHLGHHRKYMPMNQGFDSFFGIPYSNNMSIAKEFDISEDIVLTKGYTKTLLAKDIEQSAKDWKKLMNKAPLMRDYEVVEYPADQKTLTARYTEASIKFINENKSKPFFLYLAHAMPHTPLFVEDKYRGTSKAGLYGATIERIDWGVGEIVKTLKNLDLFDDTLIVFTSDNGPAQKRRGIHAELRGKKFMTYEGGHRVPGIITCPSHIEAGQVHDGIISQMDLLKSICTHVGAEVPNDRVYDSYDMWPLLSGKESKSPRDTVYFYVARKSIIDGVRYNEWKYLSRGSKNQQQVGHQLYNLKDDPIESINLADKYPEKVHQLKKMAKDFDSSIKKEIQK